MRIRDLHLEFEGATLSKFGLFALLAWFLVDVLELERRFRPLTVKRKRNRQAPVKRRRSPFLAPKLCLGLVTTTLLGIRRFENLTPLLHTESSLAGLIGLERFFSRSTARNFINACQLWHLRQLDRINLGLLRDWGECSRQDFPVVDIDSQTHTLESRKREGAVVGFNRKRPGKPCYQWSVAFVRGEVVSQRLLAGNQKASTDAKARIEDVKAKLGLSHFIIRLDGGYFSGELLDWIVEQGLGLVTSARYDWVTAQPENHPEDHRWVRYDEKTRVLDLGVTSVVRTSAHRYRIVLVEKEQEPFPGSRRRAKTLRYAVIAHLPWQMRPEALYEFYHQRQTIENFFKEAQNPFSAGKMPSQRFRANEAYLGLVTLAYNCFTIFKKTLCRATGEETLLKQLRLS